MPTVGMLLPKFGVHLADRDIRIPPVQIHDPLQFLRLVGVRMDCVRLVRVGKQRFFRSVIQPVPAHKRRFGNVVATADE